jgi:dissimilatory sulfite reductase (desulfoviridin) alpha/beta subunit
MVYNTEVCIGSVRCYKLCDGEAHITAKSLWASVGHCVRALSDVLACWSCYDVYDEYIYIVCYVMLCYDSTARTLQQHMLG